MHTQPPATSARHTRTLPARSTPTLWRTDARPATRASGSFGSDRSRSVLVRRVPVVQHEVVAVRVAEERHVAHAGVERVAVELDTLRLELCARRSDVVDAQRPRVALLRHELH